MTDRVFDLLKECVAGKSQDDYVFSRPARKGAGTLFRFKHSAFGGCSITITANPSRSRPNWKMKRPPASY